MGIVRFLYWVSVEILSYHGRNYFRLDLRNIRIIKLLKVLYKTEDYSSVASTLSIVFTPSIFLRVCINSVK